MFGARRQRLREGMIVSELRYDDRVALITGAAGGLGLSYARLLASRGARLVINDVSEAAGRAAAGEIAALGGTALADSSDIGDPVAARALVTGAIAAFGRLDIVIHNAGIIRDQAFHKMTPDQVDAVLRVHLLGGFHVLRAAWGHLRERRYGRVLTTTSGAGLYGNFGQANYAAAKMGLVGLTRTLAIEGMRYGIQANVLAPLARTAMTEGVLGDLAGYLDPGLVAPVAAWLVHADCPETGQVFSAGGGRVARVFVGVTRGYRAADLTPEDVRDHAAAIADESGFLVPAAFDDEIALLRG